MGLLKISTKVLTVLLLPVILLERKLVKQETKDQFGAIKRKERIGAHVERWGLLAFGFLAGASLFGTEVGSVALVGIIIAALLGRMFGLGALSILLGSLGTGGILSGLWVGGVVTLGFGMAGIADPHVWCRGKTDVFIGKEEYILGLVVNAAPIWLFWLGYIVGWLI